MATMKKIILSLLFMFLISGSVFAQVKVNLFLQTPRVVFPGGYWKIDVMATILTGQTWRVGSSNIRVDWVTTPANSVSIRAENPAINPYPCLHNNSNYSAMTTTSILGGTAISLNISRLNNCCVLTPGTYKLGEIRFNRLDTTGCIRLTIRTNSVLQDSITQMNTPANWTMTNDTSCIRLDVLVGNNNNNSEIPRVFKLYNNYPNPFNPATTLKYDVPKSSFVQLTIFDILGKEIDKLVNQNQAPGRYEVVWDARNYASGSYFYKFETEYFTDIKKMILIK